MKSDSHSHHAFTWRVAFILSGAATALPGKIQEISPSSCAVLQPQNLPAGSRGKLYFDIPSADYKQHQYLELDAQVIHSTLVGGLSQYRTTFKFSQQHPQLTALLDKLP